MLYLVIEILLFVIVAGLLGVLCGWFLRGGNVGRERKSRRTLEAEIDNKNEALFQVRSQLAAATELLRESAEGEAAQDPRLVALLTGRYRRPAKANGAGPPAGEAPAPASAANSNGKGNGNGALPLGRRLGQARSLRPPRPASRRTRWARRAKRPTARPGLH